MQAKNIALATVLAAVFAGNAFAAQPVSGEGPLFQNEAVASTLSREAVRNEAVANLPAAGINSAVALKADALSNVTRAEVRQQIRNAIAQGYQVKSGEMS